MDLNNIQTQLNEQKRKVDFNTYDMSLKELVSMVKDGIINISPDYQRQFRWEDEKQSRLIESLFLGIPIPSLFMATNPDGTWEVIDGVQRISSIINFMCNQEDPIRNKIGKVEPLVLKGLSKLTSFNECVFQSLPKTIRLDFQLKPMKVITLSDKSDKAVRFDLFERLNTGGVKLSEQEIRNCVYGRGEFIKMVKQLSANEDYRSCLRLTEKQRGDGTYEELIVRFFAYLYNRENFEHGVKDFLNEFADSADDFFDFYEGRTLFARTFAILKNLEFGIVKQPNRKVSSLILFEAVAVGAAAAIKEGIENLKIDDYYEWVLDPEFNKLITGATNSKSRLVGRIEFCKDKFSRQ